MAITCNIFAYRRKGHSIDKGDLLNMCAAILSAMVLLSCSPDAPKDSTRPASTPDSLLSGAVMGEPLKPSVRDLDGGNERADSLGAESVAEPGGITSLGTNDWPYLSSGFDSLVYRTERGAVGAPLPVLGEQVEKPASPASSVDEIIEPGATGEAVFRDYPAVSAEPMPFDAPPPGYHREFVAWSDAGYCTTYALPKAPYQTQKYQTDVLREARSGVRTEDVPDEAPIRVLMFFDTQPTRYPHYSYLSVYRKHPDGWHYTASVARKRGAVNSLSLYPSIGERVMVQLTYPYDPATIQGWVIP